MFRRRKAKEKEVFLGWKLRILSSFFAIERAGKRPFGEIEAPRFIAKGFQLRW